MASKLFRPMAGCLRFLCDFACRKSHDQRHFFNILHLNLFTLSRISEEIWNNSCWTEKGKPERIYGRSISC